MDKEREKKNEQLIRLTREVYSADRALFIKFLVENYPNDDGTNRIYIDMDKVRNLHQAPVGKADAQEQPPPVAAKMGLWRRPHLRHQDMTG